MKQAVTKRKNENDINARLGFKIKKGTTHTARTMMLDELKNILSWAQETKTSREEYLKFIIEDNCLGKRYGVRLNIRPFMTVGDVKKKGAGVLRDKPNIKWGKDRGRDVASAPCYKLGLEYGGKEGDRINDHHLTLEEKRAAREKSK